MKVLPRTAVLKQEAQMIQHLTWDLTGIPCIRSPDKVLCWPWWCTVEWGCVGQGAWWWTDSVVSLAWFCFLCVISCECFGWPPSPAKQHSRISSDVVMLSWSCHLRQHHDLIRASHILKMLVPELHEGSFKKNSVFHFCVHWDLMEVTCWTLQSNTPETCSYLVWIAARGKKGSPQSLQKALQTLQLRLISAG